NTGAGGAGRVWEDRASLCRRAAPAFSSSSIARASSRLSAIHSHLLDKSSRLALKYSVLAVFANSTQRSACNRHCLGSPGMANSIHLQAQPRSQPPMPDGGLFGDDAV